MSRVLCLGTAVMLLAACALARMGETKAECMGRYDQCFTNYPGIGDVTSVDFYRKGDIVVGLWFVRGAAANAEPRVGMIYYSKIRPTDTPRISDRPGLPSAPAQEDKQGISKEDIDAFLATIPGRWEDYSPPPSLAGRPSKVIPLTSMPSVTIRNRDATASVVQRVYRKVYPPALRYEGTNMTHVAHNGPKLFACRIGGGLAICSHDAVQPLTEWVNYMEKSTSEANPGQSLQGF